MTVFAGARRAVRFMSIAALGLGLAFGAAACGGDPEIDSASGSDPAAVTGEDTDRVQLTEGVPFELSTGSDETTSLTLAGYKEGDDPAVVIAVDGAAGSEEHTLHLGDEMAIGDSTWRVSEIGMNNDDSRPGSATLTRDEGGKQE
ncbi:hypothetical protein CDO52_10165 [Nocardiopsis gilva YIM 90087]|uniref:DUF5666 domain-containing protein n=1 Tax=Nocardiopsis gilva YIM 90087 TaxID=1235441 RepID=A0A223S4L7_9ACTN|nr:DUF6406 domain-containing protein [Nocardiopsis gilva]ASU83096.1 hypothetical protein CDO52_10165 [Nocardiopsis gilva YIM 90087]